jgi:cation-transporting ATPase E
MVIDSEIAYATSCVLVPRVNAHEGTMRVEGLPMNEGTGRIAGSDGKDQSGVSLTGLSSAEVERKIAAGQFNKPPQSATKSVRRIIRDNVASVFNLIIGLIILFLLSFYVASDDKRLLLDAVGVFTVALFNTAIAIFQEVKAKRALDNVNMLLAREVTVVRDGVERSVPQEQIVLDDVIVLRRGDQAVVDGTMIQSHHLEIDESLLTGESTPIEKEADDRILSGSFCLSGNGFYRVTQLSDDSYAAQMTRLAQQLKITTSPLQRQINRIVIWLFAAAVALCLIEALRSALDHQLGVEFARRLATIAIGLVPQGLVLMASVTFAIGIYRISRVGALVQAFNAIESFANVQVICMDKTGTLTENRMTVRRLTALDDSSPAGRLERQLGTYAQFSSDKNATIRALESFAADPACVPVYEVPFSSQRKMSLLGLRGGDRDAVYVLGAFEMLIERCDDDERQRIVQAATELDVYRNLFFGEVINPDEIARRADDLGPFKVKPLGIVSLSDTVREEVCEVIREFEQRGIQFKILSGDSTTSIRATCRDIGWEVTEAQVITGTELDRLDDAEWTDAVDHKTVFARLRPEHKVKIVQALRAKKIYTAMIGDGVNDVPAIKQADLGFAMDEGASITKEVADIILLKNRFTLLPEVFEEGKKITNTVGSVARLFLTKNFMVIYLTLLSALLAWEFPLTPRRVSLINIFAIGLPAMVIALTNTNTGRHKRFLLDLLSFVAVSALVIVLSGYAGFFLVKGQGQASETLSQAASMVMLSVMVVNFVVSFVIVAALGGKKRWRLYIVYAASMIALYFLVVGVEANNRLLSLIKTFYEISSISGREWVVMLSVCAASALVLVVAQKLRLALIDR